MSLFQFLKSKLFLKQLVIAVLSIAVLIFVMMKWLTMITNHNQKIEVPNLEKMSLEKVETKLQELDLNYVVVDSASYNPNYPKKSVIEQSPSVGDFVKENRKIYLTLNPSGYANVEIPDLYGKTKRQATSQLLAIGFKISPKAMYVSDIAKDVIRGLRFKGKELKAGDKIPKNSVINLKLGDGRGTGRYIQNMKREN
ncbi:serine/threonine protein kinase [Lutibacter profundi]|uniref:Serine/threonine protein kinase n=1 Tax=Lutibacter profundi TaxID=1622118 RepID=A0A0X8G5S3_9FLAO|nr:PASTA domain-containing protein [Lutibacter profundi]AMC10559.1 serine/threonine protein kinase [Lutibacter profundi]